MIFTVSMCLILESSESASTFLTFGLFAVFVSTLAGLIPAWRAARMNPADALRNE